MKRRILRAPVLLLLTASLMLPCGGGCSENGGGRLKLHPIYECALWGAAIGGIIGYQSDEAGEGAALGAAIFGIGALLEQTDKMPEKHRDDKHDEREVVIQVQNDNGSLTPVVLKKKGSTYMGPNGELYDRLPTAEQLKPVYGL